MPESSAQNKLDRAIDFSLGLLSKEEESALLSEARQDVELEAMMRQQCASQERARAEGFGSVKHSPDLRAAGPSRATWARRRLAIAASVLAASIALVLWMQLEPSPDLYWLPVDSVLSTQRSIGSEPDAFRVAIEFYAAHDLDAAIVALEHYEAQGSARDLASLYLASALLNRDRGVDATKVLDTIELESLPHPWRGYGQELEQRIQDDIDR
jgi:hypothetical protein